MVNDGPAAAACVFTANRCVAHPVVWSREVVKDGQLRAVVLNSGGANCYTGPDGFLTTHRARAGWSDRCGRGAIDVAVCSTGLIGEPLDADCPLLAGIRLAHTSLSVNGGSLAAEAILTTDTVHEAGAGPGDGWVVGGMAKGAGMLAPSLATMLVVLTTDAAVDATPATVHCELPPRDDVRSARLRRLHVDQRHPCCCWRAAPRA